MFMLIEWNRLQRRFLVMVAILGTCPVAAEPYLAFKTNNDCSACHVNPTGGGARNAYGSYYGSQVLPAEPDNQNVLDGGQITENIRLGSDFRFNLSYLDQEAADESKGFNTEYGQIYVALKPKGSRFTAYFDQQIVPGSSLTREAFLMARFNQRHYLKAGKFIVPYGIKLQDDDAFIRQATQINFDTSDSGVEWGMNHNKLFWQFAVTNGSSGQNNDDQQFQYVGRGEYIGNNWRVGSTYLFNDAEAGERQMFNIFGGFNFAGYIFLFEMDRIEDDSISNVPGENLEQLVGLFEVNKEVTSGVNLKFTAEYLDPDSNIDENERTRHSLMVEYTPYAFVQIRGGVRVGDDIPQREQGNYTEGLVQLHFYY
jgi:hypothetical protein